MEIQGAGMSWISRDKPSVAEEAGSSIEDARMKAGLVSNVEDSHTELRRLDCMIVADC